jgi:hypothetical protein
MIDSKMVVVAINSKRDRIHSLYILSTETKQVTMVWSVVHRVITLFWDTLRYSCLSPDDKTLELLLLRQQILMLRRHKKRGPHLAHSEKFILVTLVEQLHHRAKLKKTHLAHLGLSSQKRCYAGIVSWSGASGPSATAPKQRADRRLIRTWCNSFSN